MFKYALFDTSGHVPLTAIHAMIAAASLAAPPFLVAWNQQPIQGRTIQTLADLALDEMPFYFRRSDPSVPGAEGFHDKLKGRPYAELLTDPVLNNGGGVLDGGKIGSSLSGVFTHELWESIADLYCATWCLMPDGRFLAQETADPVQGTELPYVIADKTVVHVSDAVLPEYFNDEAPSGSRFSLSGAVKAPFQLMPHGYQIIFDPSKLHTRNGPISNVFGRQVPQRLVEHKLSTSRRLARRAR